MDAEVTPDVQPLTEHQQRVFRRLVEGESNPEIAKALGLAEKTVKTHLTKIFKKLGFTTRARLIVWYYKDAAHG